MRIQHNIMAMNAYRNYNTNTSALSKNLEKLSSGYKINRAGDDAAGLAISEKMRAQITGLETAQKNAKDGISLVQTAEGALTEVHDMLNRMTELATQSANGTFDEKTDRAQLQKEVEALKSEINRIADSANFNGIQLLDGSLSSTSGVKDVNLTYGTVSTIQESQSRVEAEFKIDLDGFAIKNTGAAAATMKAVVNIGGVALTVQVTNVAANSIAKGSNFQLAADTTITIDGIKYVSQGQKLEFKAKTTTKQDYTNAGKNPAFDVTATASTGQQVGNVFNTGSQVVKVGRNERAAQVAKVEFNLDAKMIQKGTSIKIGKDTFTFNFDSTAVNGTEIGIKDLLNDDGTFNEQNLDKLASRLTTATRTDTEISVAHAGGGKIVVTTKSSVTATASVKKYDSIEEMKDLVGVTQNKSGSALTLQIGDTSDGFNKLEVSIEDIHTKSLGIEEIDIGTQDGAQKAISVVKEAINKVSDVRGTLGATQNRLDHTMNNLSVMTENIQDAESTIRDTDVADEMMAYTKNNILIQSAQAMLAQANQVPQGVLQLLQ